METPDYRESSRELDSTKKYLFQICMKGLWGAVVEIYEKEKWVHKAKITRSGDTALHVAVSDGQEDVVAQLVKLILSNEDTGQSQEALRVQNERGNTALHFAASMGSVQMCLHIAKIEPSLVCIRNVDGETPLFLAALHGRKDAFLCLHHICPVDSNSPNYYSNCRRNDGDTILHCAIAGDYFDLAFQIIHLYEDLVNWVNESGSSPLHLLASKPSAFRSGSHLGRYETIVYHCIYVNELQIAIPNCEQCTTTGREGNCYPQNYETCVNLLKVIKDSASVVTTKFPLARFLINKCVRKNKDQPRAKTSDIEEASKNAVSNNNGAEAELSGSQVTEDRAWSHPLFPANYRCCVDLFRFLFLFMLVISGKGTTRIEKIRRKKEKHVWCVQVMNELLHRASLYEYDDTGSKPQLLDGKDKALGITTPYAFDEEGAVTYGNITPQESQPSTSTTKSEAQAQQQQQNKEGENDIESEMEKQQETRILITAKNGLTEMVEKIKELFPVAVHDMDANKKNIVLLTVDKSSEMVKKQETPILIAAKNGVTEMVEKIMELFPVAVHDMDANKKNIVLLAVENRQSHVYELLLKRKFLKESLFRKVDNEGNSALHLAAKLGDYKPWLIPGAALQMHWEIKWYLYVKESMPAHFFRRYNKECKTPREVFTHTHRDLIVSGRDWLNKTSESCSVVAALIATVAFATSTTVPGGVNQDSGIPTLENKPVFNVFAISSLIALCCSVTAVVMFLSILTSRYQENDFAKDLPRKLISGLTSLFMSIAAMLVSFCAGHFFVLREKLKYAAFPVYAVTCLPVTLFALAQFPLYFDLIRATFKKVPQRSYKASLL